MARLQNGGAMGRTALLKTKRYPVAVCVIAGLITIAALWGRSGIRATDPGAARAARMRRLPHLMLWAWARREDLSFIDPRETGVAVLAGTVFLSGDAVVARPRFQPLLVPPGTVLIGAVRIQADHSRPIILSPAQRARAVKAIEHLVWRKIAALQIDFDAASSQRRFYRDLLTDLRHDLPATLPLTITAIASWCIHDDWLASLPIDEAVPMLFRMGPDDERVRAYFAQGGDCAAAVARRSAGVATDELMPRLPPGRRVYIFSPHAWSREQEARAMMELKPWPSSLAAR
jgi:hypothetical protein